MMIQWKVKRETILLKSSLCDYSDAYILVRGTITIAGARQAGERNKGVVFKNCTPFTICICKINNTQLDNANTNAYFDIIQ